MSVTVLNPSIPLQTVRGDGEALALIDYGPEHDLMWVVAMDHNGQIWTIRNPDVRVFKNISIGRDMSNEPGANALLSALIAAHLASPTETERQMRACLKPDDYRALAKSLIEVIGYSALMPEGAK